MDLMCLLCVMGCKVWDQTIASARPEGMERPVIRKAVTLCAMPQSPVTPICYECLTVVTQSPLSVPNGVRLPPPPKGV
jgi:hypothetical protein